MLLPRYYFSDEFSDFKPMFDRYAVREQIYEEKEQIMAYDRSYSVFYIEKGKAQVAVSHENGKQHILMFFGPGSLFPLRCRNQTYYLESSIIFSAMTECIVLEIPASSVEQMIMENPRFGVACVDHYSRFGNFLFYRTTSFSTEDGMTRTCNFLYLYGLYDRECRDIVPFSQTEIAEIVGVSRIQITRLFSELRNLGIIRTNVKYTKILDRDRLLQMCSDFAKDSSV